MAQRGWVSTTLIILLIIAGGVGVYFYQSLHSNLKQLSSAHEIALSEGKRLEQELSKARQRLAQRSTSAERLEARLNEAQESLAESANEQKALRRQIQNLDGRIDDLESALSASQTLASSQGEQLAKSQARIRALITSREQLGASLASAREKQKEARARANELSTSIETTQAELQQASKRLAQQETRIVELETRRQQLESSLATALEEQARTRLQADQLAEELGNTQAALDQARDQLAQRESRLEEVAEERQSVAEQYREAREQLALQRVQSRSASETIKNLEATLQRESSAMNQLQTRLQALSDEKQTLIQRLEDGTTVIKLPENIVFDSGSARIGESGRKTLQLVATALESFPDHLISVQGHSDSRPISPSLQQRYPTNWELSAARAASALRVLRDTGIAPERMQAVGYANTRPLVEEIDSSSRRINRRIEVLLYPKRFNVKALTPR